MVSIAHTKLFAASQGLFNGVLGKRPSQAFAEQLLDPTLETLFGTTNIPSNDKIKVVAADLAENGAVVPVKVETEFVSARSITLLASKNPVPLVAKFDFTERVRPFVATRVKLAESSEIIAVIDTGEELFQARRFVKVTLGGCSA